MDEEISDAVWQCSIEFEAKQLSHIRSTEATITLAFFHFWNHFGIRTTIRLNLHALFPETVQVKNEMGVFRVRYFWDYE